MDKFIMDKDGHLSRNPNYKMNKLQEIKDESLYDEKGVIVHIDNFKWLIKQAEKVEELTKVTVRYHEINKGLLDKQFELREEINQLKKEKEKWFNAYHKLIMKPF